MHRHLIQHVTHMRQISGARYPIIPNGNTLAYLIIWCGSFLRPKPGTVVEELKSPNLTEYFGGQVHISGLVH